jgi:type IV secretory pathway VirB2 component (pilin)
VFGFIAVRRERAIEVIIGIAIFFGDAFGVQELFELGSL